MYDYDVYDMVEALIGFLEIEDEENIGIWSDDSLTYEGVEYELYREENDKWSKLLGVYNGWFIYQTDNPV